MADPHLEPLQSFRFLVKVQGEREISAAFTDCSAIRMEAQTLTGRTGGDRRGVQTCIPVLTRYAPVTLRRGVVGDYAFLDWVFAASAQAETGPSGKDLYRTVEIIALNDRGQPGVTWTLRNAVPIGYEVSPLDSSRSAVLTESLTLAFTGMQRKTS